MIARKARKNYSRRKRKNSQSLGIMQKLFLFAVLFLLLWTRILSSYSAIREVRASYPTNVGHADIVIPHIDDHEEIAVQHVALQNELATNPKVKLQKISEQEKMADRIEAFLNRWNSPMASKSLYIVQTAEAYGIDPRLIPAISIAESSGGNYCFRPYNAWGYGKSGFASWEDGILKVTSGIARGYGTSDPYAIGPSYNPVTPDAWSAKVAGLMAQI